MSEIISRQSVEGQLKKELFQMINATAVIFLMFGSFWSHFILGANFFYPQFFALWLLVHGLSVLTIFWQHKKSFYVLSALSFLSIQCYYFYLFKIMGFQMIPHAPHFFIAAVFVLASNKGDDLRIPFVAWAAIWSSLFVWANLYHIRFVEFSFLTAMFCNFLCLFSFYALSVCFMKKVSLRFAQLGPRSDFDNMKKHSDRLQSLGELSASLSHEISTPMINISGLIDKVDYYVKDTKSIQNQKLDIIKDAMTGLRRNVSKVIHITSAVRRFSRNQEIEKQVVSIKNIVEETLFLIQSGYELAGVELKIEYPNDEYLVYANEVQISQILVNLLQNAKDACLKSERKIVNFSMLKQGKMLAISVKDSGLGIDQDIQDNIFEPYFTTKNKENGTGLGLYICRKILSAHDGHIKVNSSDSRGTHFIVEIPLYEEQSLAA